MVADYHLKCSHENFGLKWKIFDVKEKTYLMKKLISFVPVILKIIDEVIVLIYTRFHFVSVGFHVYTYLQYNLNCLHICSTFTIVFTFEVHFICLLFKYLRFLKLT